MALDLDHVSVISDEEIVLNASGNQVISVATNKMNLTKYVELKESDFLRLEYGKWLNDNLLDYGMYSLSHCMNTNDASKIQLFLTFLSCEAAYTNCNLTD